MDSADSSNYLPCSFPSSPDQYLSFDTFANDHKMDNILENIDWDELNNGLDSNDVPFEGPSEVPKDVVAPLSTNSSKSDDVAPYVVAPLGTNSSKSDVVAPLGTNSSKGDVVEATTTSNNNPVMNKTSEFRGVSRRRNRGTTHYEARLWDSDRVCESGGKTKRGGQVYLGAYIDEKAAARAYDLAALKYFGRYAFTNFPNDNYKKEIKAMKSVTKDDFVKSLLRKSYGFSRGASAYRGVTKHEKDGKWSAKIGRLRKGKDIYLGSFSDQKEAAEAYDIALIKLIGPIQAKTNFDIKRYDVIAILDSYELPKEKGRGGARKQEKKIQDLGKYIRKEERVPEGGESSSSLAFQSQSSNMHQSGGNPDQQQQQEMVQFDQPQPLQTLQKQNMTTSNQENSTFHLQSWIKTPLQLHQHQQQQQQQSGDYDGGAVLLSYYAAGLMGKNNNNDGNVINGNGGDSSVRNYYGTSLLGNNNLWNNNNAGIGDYGGSVLGSYGGNFVGNNNNNGLVGMSPNSSSSNNNNGLVGMTTSNYLSMTPNSSSSNNNNGLEGMTSNYLSMTSNSSSSNNAAGSLFGRIDFHLANDGYGGWLGESVRHDSNGGAF